MDSCGVYSGGSLVSRKWGSGEVGKVGKVDISRSIDTTGDSFERFVGNYRLVVALKRFRLDYNANSWRS